MTGSRGIAARRARVSKAVADVRRSLRAAERVCQDRELIVHADELDRSLIVLEVAIGIPQCRRAQR